jgi:hypothetical protein
VRGATRELRRAESPRVTQIALTDGEWTLAIAPRTNSPQARQSVARLPNARFVLS